MNLNEIGGGVVRRTFRMGSEQVFSGKKLTREQILAMPIVNRTALIEKKYIEVFMAAPGDRHIIALTEGGFDVIEGRKLNEFPLTRAQAHELAGTIDEVPKPHVGRGNKRKAEH